MRRALRFFDSIFRGGGGGSEVQFALEQDGDRTLCKVYLEYWDRLVERLGRGETGPALLNLGFKWPAGRPREMVQERYICHPKLRHRSIIERLSACQGQLSEQVVALVEWASETVADGSLVYLEVDDATGGGVTRMI